MLSLWDALNKTVAESSDEDDEEEEEEEDETAEEGESDEEGEFGNHKGFNSELRLPTMIPMEKIDPRKELALVTHPANGPPYSKIQRLLLLVRLEQNFCWPRRPLLIVPS